MRNRAIVVLASSLAMFVAGCEDPCIAPGGGCAASCALNAANVCVPKDQLGSPVPSDGSAGSGGSVITEPPPVGQVKFLSQKYPVQGVMYSGYQEVNEVTFQVLDSAGQPYPAGLDVNFSHASVGGSFLGPTPSCSGGICTASARTDSSGQAKVLLTSGRSAGLASVTATATGSGVSANGSASSIAIIGARSSGAHITIDCTPKNVPVLSATDCSYSHYAGPGSVISCSASFADRFNNVLGVSTLATFASEAGSAGPPTWTAAYDPTKPAAEQRGLGIASDYIDASGGKLPVDVVPFQGETLSATYQDACGTTQHNPRDGLVTVIVMANGEEGFVDVNGNGQYDVGEPFVDMGEPYLDQNDNGQWDPDEPYYDVNGNGKYDGPNGVWDANTVVWAETRILFTGQPLVASAATSASLSRFISTADADAAPEFKVLGTPGPASSQTFGLVFADGNFNAITPAASYSIGTAGSGMVTAKYTQLPGATDALGISFTQQYCDKPIAPTTCSSVCKTSPCYVVTNVGACDLASRASCSGFPYGSTSQAVVTGTCTSGGSDVVQATAKVNDVSTTISLGGSCSACESGLNLCNGACVDTDTDPKNCGHCGTTCASSQSCQQGQCWGAGATSPYVISAAGSSTRIPADGKATVTVTATVSTVNGAPVPGRNVSFALDGVGSLSGASSAVTDASGHATVTFVSDVNGGTANVKATDTGSGQDAYVTIVMPKLGQVNALAPQYQAQGVRYSGYQETNQLTFQLLDTYGQPYPAGLAVRVWHDSIGVVNSPVFSGSYLGGAPNCSSGIPSRCELAEATDASGQVRVLLTSGQIAGVASVTAEATAGMLSASGTVRNLAIIGAKANGARLSLDCGYRNVPAFTDSDGLVSNYIGPGDTVTCSASFADRFNNVLATSTLAYFASEAGYVGPPTWTPQYDSTKTAMEQTSLGIATEFVRAGGGNLPADVAPFADESYRLVNGIKHNPRDGLVTVIVMASGEEGFVDLNGNGKYDPGEPFIDMGEPYVDANDNGKWDSGERFFDLNRDGVYNGPNGKWDADTVIWAETRILYSGVAEVATVGAQDAMSRFFVSGDAGTIPAPTAFAPEFSVLGTKTGPSSTSYGVVFMDANLNPLAPAATYDIATSTGGVTAVFSPVPASRFGPALTTAGLGMAFSQQYCDDPVPPTNCSSVCKRAPCYVVTNVGACDLAISTPDDRVNCAGFSYGSWGQAVITGACSDSVVRDTVQATATINGVSTRIAVAGTCTP